MKENILKTVKGDIFGGITAGIIALPLALGFGVASGLGAAAGLYGAIILGLFAALFGGTRTQISGPTGPMTVIVASVAALYSDNLAAVFVLMSLSGLFQIVYGLCRVGKFINLVPNPVVSGFMTGIGCIIITLQLNPFLGQPSSGGTLSAIKSLLALPNVNIQCVILAAAALLIVFLTPKKIGKTVPPSLLALVACTILAVLLHFSVPAIGSIPNVLPEIKIAPIDLKTFFDILPLAFGLSLLGSIDSLLTSLVADKQTNTKHDSNKELIGQGLGNMFAGIFGGLAGAGATMRTVINIKSGATTRLSGTVHSLVLILILLVFAPLAELIPIAVLSGILIKIGIDIMDWEFLKNIHKISKRDTMVMLTVLFITVFGNLILAVAVGVVLHAIFKKIPPAQHL
ncbi:sulfate permease, SulP family [Candidatus Gastranaerophilus sp. (ex Termes propinquus)]|nr:sulfate permease, SulP family [Candidatus Gastranaerophilus sp. (ex Termes propinquus)]